MTNADTVKNSSEAARAAWEAARRYMDESATIGRTYISAWTASAQAGLRTAMDLQNAMIQASRTVLDAMAQANRSWFDQSAESVRKAQDATARFVAAGVDMMDSAMPRPRI